MRTLSRCGRRGVQPLIAAMEGDPDRENRAVAAFLLSEITHESAVPALARALSGPDPTISLFAAQGLAKIGWRPADGAQQVRMAIPLKDWNRLKSLGSGAVAPLVAALRDGNGKVREKVAEALHKLGWQPAGSEERVLYGLARRDWESIEKAWQAAVEHLVAFLRDADRPACEFAAASLAKIQDRRAREPLEAALPEVHEDAQRMAAEALVEAGDASAVEIPTRTFCRLGQPLRESLSQRLSFDARWIPVLVAALEDSSCEVRNTAARSLKTLAWTPADKKERARWLVAMRLWEDAVRLGDVAIGLLASIAEAPDEKLEDRQAAVGALVRMALAQCVPALLPGASPVKCS